MNKKLFIEVKELFLIAIGTLIYVLAWNIFFFPHEVAGGGATGISTIIMYATQGMLPESAVNFFNSIGMASVGGGFPVSVTYLVLNLILLAASVKELGWKFSLRSIYGVFCVTAWFWIPFGEILADYTPKFDPFMSTIVGSIAAGFGMGIIFANSGSTGGTDIIAKIVNKYRSISLGKALLWCDVVVISSTLLMPYGDIEKVIYGLIVTFVLTSTVDLVINGMRQSVQFFIFSKEYTKIADTIQNELHRGVTILNGQGWYSKQDVKVITVMCRKQESNKIFGIVKDIDRDAFISQSAAIGVYGHGFDPIGTK